MPNFYVANTTKQRHHFVCRFKEFGRHARRMIEPGKQILLGNFDDGEINDIIEQYAKYGMRPASEVSRQRGFVGLCYSIKEPADIDTLMATFERNDTQLERDGAKRNLETAQAISDAIATDLSRKTGFDKERVRPARLELETVEDTREKPSVAVGVEVVDPSRAQPRRVKSA